MVNGVIGYVYEVDWEAMCCPIFCSSNVGHGVMCAHVSVGALVHRRAERGCRPRGCYWVGFPGLVLVGRRGRGEHMVTCVSKDPPPHVLGLIL